LRIAIAHEWLDQRAGSEKVFEALAGLFPDADLFALSRNPDAEFDFGGRPVRTTFVDRFATLRARRDVTLPLMPLAWRLLGPRDRYDLVVTSSHACAKAFLPGRDTIHLSYCHSPMRYAWEADVDQRRRRAVPGIGLALGALRRWDARSARWVDGFAANSTTVRDRIRRYYGRDARVIPPPVDTAFYTPGDRRPGGEYLLAVSRFVPYKRVDVAIEAARLAGIPLVVAGSGPDEARLRALAAASGATVGFERSPSDERLRELYRDALALVFPALEDFGIVPVEAQACGTPVVAFGQGGARDTVLDGRTGALVPSQRPDDFAAAIGAVIGDVDPAACRQNAERFAPDRFTQAIEAWVADAVG
jgi:glycosyltransferase involved in cell wall biosynthesis